LVDLGEDNSRIPVDMKNIWMGIACRWQQRLGPGAFGVGRIKVLDRAIVRGFRLERRALLS
jgi:hypothetical protein